MRAAFITGASGAVGSALLPVWLDQPDAQAHVLLRTDSEVALGERLQELLRYWGWELDAERRSRIHVYRGDACAPRFGLDAAPYDALVQQCSHVIHCAGAVRMNLPLGQARHAAIDSAHEVLQLCRAIRQAGRPVKLEYVSTVGVAGRQSGLLAETWATEPRDFHNTYEQAKAEAERLVQAAWEHEALPVTVLRPSMVIGDSASGKAIHFQVFHYICEFLSGRMSWGLGPTLGQARLDLICADQVAQAIVTSAAQAHAAGQILHVCSGPNESIALSSLRQRVRQLYGQHGLHIPRHWQLSPRTLGRTLQVARRVLPARTSCRLGSLGIYLDYLQQSQAFDNRAYTAFRQRHGLPEVAMSEAMDHSIGYYLKQRHTGDSDE